MLWQQCWNCFTAKPSLTYLSTLPVVEQRTSTATSGTVTTTSAWRVWHTTTWWTRWHSALPTRSCCCLPAMTLPLRCGAHRAWSVWHRPPLDSRGPATSCPPGWTAARTQHLAAVSMENHESRWEALAVGGSGERKVWSFSSVVWIYCIYIHSMYMYSVVPVSGFAWACCAVTHSSDGMWCSDTRERCRTSNMKSPQTVTLLTGVIWNTEKRKCRGDTRMHKTDTQTCSPRDVYCLFSSVTSERVRCRTLGPEVYVWHLMITAVSSCSSEANWV